MADLKEMAQEEASMDMTPMIDVVFLLIIFFLCIDFKILEAKLPAYLPKDKGSQSNEEEPVEQLSLKIECKTFGNQVPRNKEGKVADEDGKRKPYYLTGHDIVYHICPISNIKSLKDLSRELKRIYDDKSTWQPDKVTSVLKPQAVVVEPGVAVVYNDVAGVVDVVYNSGFEEINFGGGLGAKETKK